MRFRTVARVALRAVDVRLRSIFGLRLRPYKALIELTSECNSRCTTCDIWRTPADLRKTDLRLSEITSLLRELGRDLAWLALSGGEVSLVEHFPEVIAEARRSCPNLSLVTFTTNGLLPEKAAEYARLVRDAGFDLFVTVSLDGDEEVHDRLRGVAGNHALALRTLELLRADGIRAHFGITLGDGNRDFVHERFAHYRDTIKAVTFAESGGIFRKLNPVDLAGISSSLSVVLRNYRVRGPGDFVEWIYLRLARVFFAQGRAENPIPCDVLRTSIHVRPNGDVVPCMFLPPIGNLREKSWREIRDGGPSREALQRIDRGNCPHCWLNCYAPHSIMSRPFSALVRALRAS